MIRTALLVLGVVAGWVSLTIAAAWAVPPRGSGSGMPDLADDPHWALRTPPNPVQYDRAPSIRTAVATTVAKAERAAPKSQPSPPTRQPPSPLSSNATPGVEQWRGLVDDYPWPVETMLAIMRCESGGNPLARNPSGASGLFQLLPGPPGWQDPATNIRLAYEMKYVPSGLRPWDASRGCWG